jgi:hypothetical protein
MAKTEVQADTLEIDDLELVGVGDAIAARIKAALAGKLDTDKRPGTPWNRTGHLLRSVSAHASDEGAIVTVASDRLRDSEVARKFATQVVPPNPTSDPKVRNAIELAAKKAITVKKASE